MGKKHFPLYSIDLLGAFVLRLVSDEDGGRIPDVLPRFKCGIYL